jgi:predicted flavoprotein YhiN
VNLTNTLDISAFLERFGRAASRFMRPALAALDRDALLRFFAELGVRCAGRGWPALLPRRGQRLRRV